MLLVALLNLGYFGVEFGVALRISSVSLFADSVDFLEDTSVNLIILLALGWSAYRRSLVGTALSVILLIPSAFTLWTIWQKLAVSVVPNASALSVTGLGALCVNLSCASILARHRSHSGSLTRAAFLSARNDAVANLAIIAAGVVTAATLSLWPDLVVGLGILLINLGAAREVFKAARGERVANSVDSQTDKRED